jgi:hypothetical protein
MVKICYKCSIDKPIEDFNKCSASKDGYSTYCKTCKKEIDGQRYIINKDKICSVVKIYRESNKEIISIKKKTYTIENAEIISKWQKEYRIKNDAKLKQYDKERKKGRKQTIGDKWRGLLYLSLRRLGQKKSGHTIDLLGYSPHQLKEHLESLFVEGMSWNNYGEWHIDHKIPVCSFSADTPPSVVNALSNLQPLWAKDNMVKGKKIM